MKKFLHSILAISLLAVTASAADFSTNAAAGKSGLIAGRVKINSITALNTTTNVINLVHLFDAPTSVSGLPLTYTNASYTVVGLAAPSQLVMTYTNIFGTIELWTNLATTTASATISAITNTYPKKIMFQLGASSSATWTPSVPTFTTLGLVCSNDYGVSFTINYNR